MARRLQSDRHRKVGNRILLSHFPKTLNGTVLNLADAFLGDGQHLANLTQAQFLTTTQAET